MEEISLSLSKKSSSSSQSSSSIKSSSESAIEDYDWIKDENFSLENKMNFLKYPLNFWREIAYVPNLEKGVMYSEGEFYKSRVKKVLKYDVFNGFNFIKNKYGMIEFDFMEYYNVDQKELTESGIAPQFFVYQIEVEKFNKLLEERKYMMKTFQKMNTNKKYVSIIGEIKVSHRKAFKNNSQRQDYIKFIQKAISSEEELVLMYIYDESYKLFMEDKPNKTDNIFLILCYIPKLYFNECYNAYNNILEDFGVEKIDIENKQKKNPAKKELIESTGKFNKGTSILIVILILIIAFLLKIINNNNKIINNYKK